MSRDTCDLQQIQVERRKPLLNVSGFKIVFKRLNHHHYQAKQLWIPCESPPSGQALMYSVCQLKVFESASDGPCAVLPSCAALETLVVLLSSLDFSTTFSESRRESTALARPCKERDSCIQYSLSVIDVRLQAVSQMRSNQRNIVHNTVTPWTASCVFTN